MGKPMFSRQDSMGAEKVDSGARMPEFKCKLYHLRSVCLWAHT